MNEQNENELLEILSNAIHDVGLWSWWTTALPEKIQIEFRGTQLYFPPANEDERPPSQIALQFRNPKSISFMTREHVPVEMADNWEMQLQNDEIEPFSCEYEHLTFTDGVFMDKMISEAKSIKTIHGYSPKENLFYKEKAKLVFWAQNAGCAVAADEMKILNHEGWIELNT